jgi:hypothetical protein
MQAGRADAKALSLRRGIGLFLVSLWLFVTVCAVRAPSFFWSVINWDESIYLLISRSMLEGNVLYTDIWDRKQPLTFVLFALGQVVFGESILSIRWLGCLGVTATCVGLYAIGTRCFGSGHIGRIGALASALLYALFSISSGGLATNTEILFAPFVVAAVALVLPWWVGWEDESPPGLAAWGSAGLLVGMATFVKLIAVFDAAFVGLLLLTGWLIRAGGRTGRHPLGWFIARMTAFAGGIVSPWILGAAYFRAVGAFDDFLFANFIFNRMNLADRLPFSSEHLWLVFSRLVMRENGLLWAALVVAVVVLVTRPSWLSSLEKRLLAILVVWAVVDTVAAISLRRLYLHYYLQPTPALTLIGGFLIAVGMVRCRRLSIPLKTLILIILLVPQGSRIAERWRQIDSMTDVPARVTEHLKPRVRPDDFIYVANDQPILYFTTGTRVPTRWAFPQFLVSPVFRQRLGIDLDREMASIFAKHPKYVIFNANERALNDPAFHRVLFDRYLIPDYELENQLFGIALFRRIASNASSPAQSDRDRAHLTIPRQRPETQTRDRYERWVRTGRPGTARSAAPRNRDRAARDGPVPR